MNKLALIAALALVSLLLPPPSAQAQTTPTNATANSQLANSNTANALGVTTGTPTTGPATNNQPKPDDRHDLHRGNDRDILQRSERPEHERLRIARRIRIEWRNRVERRIGIGRRGRIGRRRRCQHIIDPDLRGLSDRQRVVQLICS
jgi:hypothetical protein